MEQWIAVLMDNASARSSFLDDMDRMIKRNERAAMDHLADGVVPSAQKFAAMALGMEDVKRRFVNEEREALQNAERADKQT